MPWHWQIIYGASSWRAPGYFPEVGVYDTATVTSWCCRV